MASAIAEEKEEHHLALIIRQCDAAVVDRIEGEIRGGITDGLSPKG